MRFLLDTAATSMLNLKSFSSGRSKEIQVTSWSGTAATSAREVFLPEMLFGDHRLRDLRLPAIDLTPIGNACGGIILFALQREYRGRKEVMEYLRGRFLQYAPKLSYKMKLDDVKLFGDALWYTYDYEIVSPKEHLAGRGMSMCPCAGRKGFAGAY